MGTKVCTRNVSSEISLPQDAGTPHRHMRAHTPHHPSVMALLMSAKLPFKCEPPPSVSRRTHWVLCHQSQEWGRDFLTSSLSLPRGWAAWLPSWGSRKSGDKNDALRWSRKQPAWATETLVLGAQVSVAALSPLLTCVRLLGGARWADSPRGLRSW